MSRARKILAAGLILSVGLVLAWPFRKTGFTDRSSNLQSTRTPATLDSMAGSGSIPAENSSGSRQTDPSRHVAAMMASTTDPEISSSSHESSAASFDLANHPALANESTAFISQPVTPSTFPPAPVGTKQPASRPAYKTAERNQPELEKPREIIHIVHNTDTLEKLAERYLGDAGRALEIFDLNRELLSNPHLLPIGAKLRIPVQPGREID
ncbi:MAG: hypothetical protein KDA57_16620 [Planctomycetales bacterium]|nr:hypothetical protein [Planctomycetales bacterium]